jgi:hypothetical protein
MSDIEALQRIIDDPNRCAEDKNIASEALNRINDPVALLEAELIQSARKSDLASVEYHDIYSFCATHGFSVPAHELFDKWLFVSPVGREGIKKAADSLRQHDFEAWEGAAREWKDSGWKSSERLIAVLQRIADTPRFGNYHCEEVVEGANKFLAEVQRRSGESYARPL